MNKLFIVFNDNIMQQISKKNNFEVVELQKNILSSSLIENKAVISFDNKESFDNFFNIIASNNISKISILDLAGNIFLERQIKSDGDMSVFSYTKNKDTGIKFYMEISIFDEVERG